MMFLNILKSGGINMPMLSSKSLKMFLMTCIEYISDNTTSNDNISSLAETINSVWSELRNDSSLDSTLQSQQETLADSDTVINDTTMSNVKSDSYSNSALFKMLLQ